MRSLSFAFLAFFAAASLCQAQTATNLPATTSAQGGAAVLAQPAPADLQQYFAPPSGCSNNGIWFRSDYVLWWVKPAPNATPLVTTGAFNPNVPLALPVPGALDNPTTKVLYGGSDVQFGGMSGFRLQGGINLDSEGIWGIEGGGFLLVRRSSNFSAVSGANGTPFLSSPFFDTSINHDNASSVAFADDAGNVIGGAKGGIRVDNNLQLWGTEANLTARLWNSGGFRADFLFGFRYLDLQEGLGIDGVLTPFGQPLLGGFFGNNVAVGQSIELRDSFLTRNQFYGGQVGTRLFYDFTDKLSLDVLAKVALGGTHQTVAIDGSTTLYTPGAASVSGPGGLYALRSNIGTQSGSAFTVVPEVGINLAYHITPNVSFLVGYSFIYWSSVVRPGDQIDRSIDQRAIPSSPNFVPGFNAASPAAQFNRTDFWTQGINFGLEFKF